METLTKPKPDPEAEDFGHHSLFDQLKDIELEIIPTPDDYFDNIDDSWLSQELQFVAESVDGVRQQTLAKIENHLGSLFKDGPGGGGWYENKLTGQHLFLKFYDDPDQARTEFITNEIYKSLEIKAVESELVEIDGQLALALTKIPHAWPSARPEQSADSDVQASFVASAYLACDPVGLNSENIVETNDGMHLIDNGRSLIFPDPSLAKDFVQNQIPELETMLDPQLPCGLVFESITPAEIAKQARQLVGRLSQEMIEDIVGRSGLSGHREEIVRRGLIGRRQFLVEQFGQAESSHQRNPDSQLDQTLDQFDQANESQNEKPRQLRNHRQILVGSDRIENQAIDIIDARQDRNFLELHFKIKPEYAQEAASRVVAAKGGRPKIGRIKYQSLGPDSETRAIARSLEADYGDLTVQIGSESYTENGRVVHLGEAKIYFPLGALGMVQINVPCFEGAEPDWGAVETQVSQILADLLDSAEGLNRPDAEAETTHKLDCYGWHHKLEPGQIKDAQPIAGNLKRSEVFPGHSAVIEPGKHLKYQQEYGRFAFFHRLYNPESATQILAAGGLMSSQRRFSLGSDIEGMSTSMDFEHGSANRVFTRMCLENDGSSVGFDQQLSPSDCFLIFDPSLADRTDYFAYGEDRYGSMLPANFENRQSPQEMFEDQKTRGYNPKNEQMFEAGISTRDFRAVACPENPEDKRQLTEALMKNLLPDKDQRREFFLRGPQAVAEFLEENYQIPDPVNRLWAAGPQAVAEFLSGLGIDLIQMAVEKGPGSFRIKTMTVDSWLNSNGRMRLINHLRENGVESINGRPVEEFVVEANWHSDFVELANGQKPWSLAETNSAYYQAKNIHKAHDPADYLLDNHDPGEPLM